MIEIIVLSVLALSFIVFIISIIFYVKAYIKKEQAMTEKQKILRKAKKIMDNNFRSSLGLSYYLERSLKYAPFVTFVAITFIFINNFIIPHDQTNQNNTQPIQNNTQPIQNQNRSLQESFTDIKNAFPIFSSPIFWTIIALIPAWMVWRTFQRSFVDF